MMTDLDKYTMTMLMPTDGDMSGKKITVEAIERKFVDELIREAEIRARLDGLANTAAWCNANCCQSDEHVLLTHHNDNPLSRIAELEDQLKEITNEKEKK